MRCGYQGRKVLSAVPDESLGWVTVGLDDHAVSPGSLDAPENHLGYGITRAEIMDYLSQTYGPVFVEHLSKHLASSGDGKRRPGSRPVRGIAPSPHAP
jgi:hypothetical protein